MKLRASCAPDGRTVGSQVGMREWATDMTFTERNVTKKKGSTHELYYDYEAVTTE